MARRLAVLVLVVVLLLGGALAANAQDDPLDADTSNLVTIQFSETTFYLDAQLPDVGCSVEITP